MQFEAGGEEVDEGEERGLVEAAGVVEADDGKEGINGMDLAELGEAEEERGEGGVVVGETGLAGDGIEEIESALWVGLGGD